jgi:glyoxylase-like metal-dependent hydrolase (beta-lactamase superfamily II)
MFSDSFRYSGKITLTYSCYLIRHGDSYMLWDAGLPATDGHRITDALRQIGVAPDQVTFVGISHNHHDHIGQAADFPKATLLIGAEDFEAAKRGGVISDGSRDAGERLAPWTRGGAKVEELQRDRDVFGDGSVVILHMPGHTPGHQSLVVRLAKTGPVLITGDLYHFRENRRVRGVPTFNTDRAQTLASMDRFEAIARQLKAKVVIQHEPADIAKLPIFPHAAE